MKDINLKNIFRNTGMAYSCRVLDMEEHLLDKGDYHLSYFSPDDFETLGYYQVFHNDSLEEYSYHKEQSMDIDDMGLTDRKIVAVSFFLWRK